MSRRKRDSGAPSARPRRAPRSRRVRAEVEQSQRRFGDPARQAPHRDASCPRDRAARGLSRRTVGFVADEENRLRACRPPPEDRQVARLPRRASREEAHLGRAARVGAASLSQVSRVRRELDDSTMVDIASLRLRSPASADALRSHCRHAAPRQRAVREGFGRRAVPAALGRRAGGVVQEPAGVSPRPPPPSRASARSAPPA